MEEFCRVVYKCPECEHKEITKNLMDKEDAEALEVTSVMRNMMSM